MTDLEKFNPHLKVLPVNPIVNVSGYDTIAILMEEHDYGSPLYYGRAILERGELKFLNNFTMYTEDISFIENELKKMFS